MPFSIAAPDNQSFAAARTAPYDQSNRNTDAVAVCYYEHEADKTVGDVIEPNDLSAAAACIAAGGEPLDIRKFFGTLKEAVRFYADMRREQFSLLETEDVCFCCRAPAHNCSAKLVWAVPFNAISLPNALIMAVAPFAHFHVRLIIQWVSFSSFHRLCPRCWQRLRLNWAVKRGLYYLRVVIFLPGYYALIASVVLSVVSILDRGADPSDGQMVRWLFTGGIISVGFALFVQWFYRSMGVPPALQLVAPAPFFLNNAFDQLAVLTPG